MSDQRIIYKREDGAVMVLVPSPNCLKKYTITEIAQKDVPYGKKYKIIDKSELPDHDFIGAWEINDAELTDGTGAVSNEFKEVR